MEIIYKKVADLIPYAGNPRKNDHAVAPAAAIIKRFGFRVPLLIKSDDEVIDGHLRLKAAVKLGYEEVPCIIVDDMSDNDIRALRISVNKLAEKADWDDELLKLELDELELAGISLEEIGFELGEVGELPAEDEEVDSPEDFKEVDEGIETDHECPKCGYRWSGGK
jgi:ParB-like chromosome segregation protein Spo0J